MDAVPVTTLALRSFIADRLAVLQAVRVLIAAVATIVLRVDPDLLTAAWPAVPVLVAWLALTTMTELGRRRAGAASPRLAVAVLALDALVVGLLVGHTGGFRSPLIGLVYLHVIAISLLVSHRVALRMAAWHGIVLFGGFVLAASETSGLRLPGDVDVDQAARLAAVHAGGFLVAALGLAAFTAMNEHVLRRAHREVAAVAAVGEAVGATVDADVMLLQAASTLRSSLGLDAVAIAVADGAGCGACVASGEAEVLVHAGPGALADAVGNIATTHLVHDLTSLDGDLATTLLPGALNVIVAPFRVDGASSGVVMAALGGAPGVVVPETMVRTVEHVGRLVASAFERSMLHARIERLASSDALTGLPNRRIFEESLERELARSRRTGEPVSLVVFDVDHFKKVNDTHGHHVGDEVLRHVGGALAGAIRASDLSARFGGEEFVALLPGCGADQAVVVGDTIRRAIAAGDPPVAVTASAGVATYPLDGADGAALFAAADRALYEAKRSGRDRIVAANAEIAAVAA